MFDNCRVLFSARTPHLGALALPLDLVHGVSLARVLPPALVVLEAAVPGAGGGHLGRGGAHAGGDGDVVYGDVAQSVTADHPLEHDLRETRRDLISTVNSL